MQTQISAANNNTFGDFLKQLRRRAGLTQAELAASVHVSVAQISRLEHNERLPRVAAVAQQFIPALALENEPRLARRLIELAAAARGERPPARVTVVRTSQHVADFSTDQSAQSVRASTVPALPNRLVGRAQLLELAYTRLLNQGGRLLTLVGPPGIGKTSLGLALAAKIEDLFEHGATYVPLVSVDEPERVTLAILAALNLTSQAGAQTPQAQIIEFLRRKRMLLILDNFEQVTAAGPLIAQLLSACSGLHILVTSREPLRLRSERRLRVPPLEPAPAVELFAQRALAIEQDFVLTTDNGALIAQICHLLDRLPLAIELVAARVDLISLAEILAYLQKNRLQLVGDTTTDLPEHQQTLHRAIERSYELLQPAEQALFRTIAIFSGGCDLDAIQAITNPTTAVGNVPSIRPEPSPQLVAGMTSLANKSLLYAQPRNDSQTRFTLLETIRAYGLEQLTQRGELGGVSARHAAYFMAYAQKEVNARHGADVLWLERLGDEQDNLQTALRWLLENDPVAALRMAVLLHPFWEGSGYQPQGSRWLQLALAANPAPNLDRAYGMLRAGIYAQQRSEFGTATQFLDEAQCIFTAFDHRVGIAETLRAQGWLASDASSRQHAVKLFEASLALYRQEGDQAMISMVLGDLAHVMNDPVADYAQARAYAEESMALAQMLGRPHAIAYATQQMGANEVRAGNYAIAIKAFREALDTMRQLKAKRDIPWLLELVGETAWLQGDLSAADDAWSEALVHFQQQELRYGLMLTHHHLGQVARARGDLQSAAGSYVQSLRHCWEMNELYMVSRCLAGLGGVALGQAQWMHAAQLLAAAYRLFGTLQPFLAPTDQADYDQLRNQLHERMDATQLATDWATGDAMTTSDAVHLALHLPVSTE